MAWIHDTEGNVITPRPDGEGWSGPVLVFSKYNSGDCDGLFICLEGEDKIVLTGPDECYDIEVISEF
mgnify:FL=1